MKLFSNDNPDELILFHAYTTDVDAYIAKGVLETNGIPCIVENEIMATMYLGVGAIGGFRLMIFRRDLDAATQLLRPQDYFSE
jgi:hypothetical protein